MDPTNMIVDHSRIGAAFRRLSIPVAIQILGDQLLGTVDTIAIGNLGIVALAGATAANTIFVAIVFVARVFQRHVDRRGAAYRRGRRRRLRPYGARGRCAADARRHHLLCRQPLGAGPSIHALIGSLPSAHASSVYFILRCASILPIVISGSLIVGLGAAGNRQLGILVLVIVNLIHIPLLLMLGLGWWTHHPYGIVGAGVSSLLSETIAAGYALFYTARRPEYRIFAKLDFSPQLAQRTALLGLPEAIFLLGVTVPDIVIVALLAPLGAIAVAAFRALNIVSDLTFVVPSPLQSATQIVIGQRLGARDPAGARSFFERSSASR